jgi:hypothetical protein
MKNQQKIKKLLSLRQLVCKYPKRFPVNYRTLDEDTIAAPTATDFFEGHAQCSAYKSKGYFVFMHHFPISKPEL